MPQKCNCCVPGCLNNFRNAPELHYYRIPKDEGQRKIYKNILRNKTLKLESNATRVCSAHFEGGEKLSRNHLPSIFPWTKKINNRREIIRHPIVDKSKEKKKQRVEAETDHSDHHGVEAVNNQQASNTLHSVQDTDIPLEIEKQGAESEINENNIGNADLHHDFETNLQQSSDQTLLSGKDIDRLLEIEKKFFAIKEENARLKLENEVIKKELAKLKQEFQNNSVFDIDKYKGSDEDISFYTGLPDYDALVVFYEIVQPSAKNLSYEHEKVYTGNNKQLGRPRSLSTFQEFTMVLMRLRLGLFERDLAHRFGISLATVCRVLRTWLRFLRCEFEPLIDIPSREVTKHYMPEVFQKFYPNTTTIVDCTEVEMEKPSALDNQSMCYSSYKSRNTMKALIGISPSGVINFVSEFFPGSASDKEIVLQSNFLAKLKPGDQVMADKGFNCKDELASVGAELILPHFKHSNMKQFSKEETDHNKKVASLRIHVERTMERIKNWHIFDRRIPVVSSQLASDMLIVVCGLSNFHPPLIN